MEYSTEFFISLLVLSIVLVLLHSLLIRYLRKLMNKVAATCKEHFKPGQKDVTPEENKVKPTHDVLDDSESEFDDTDDLEGILISEDEVNLELHTPACRFYHTKYLNPGPQEGDTGDEKEEGPKDPLDDRKPEPAVLDEATSDDEEDCKCKPNGRFCYMTLIQTPPKSFTDSL